MDSHGDGCEIRFFRIDIACGDIDGFPGVVLTAGRPVSLLRAGADVLVLPTIRLVYGLIAVVVAPVAYFRSSGVSVRIVVIAVLAGRSAGTGCIMAVPVRILAQAFIRFLVAIIVSAIADFLCSGMNSGVFIVAVVTLWTVISLLIISVTVSILAGIHDGDPRSVAASEFGRFFFVGGRDPEYSFLEPSEGGGASRAVESRGLRPRALSPRRGCGRLQQYGFSHGNRLGTQDIYGTVPPTKEGIRMNQKDQSKAQKNVFFHLGSASLFSVASFQN
jgi:hypothetical protein